MVHTLTILAIPLIPRGGRGVSAFDCRKDARLCHQADSRRARNAVNSAGNGASSWSGLPVSGWENSRWAAWRKLRPRRSVSGAAFPPGDEGLSLGTPVFHPIDEDLSLGTPDFRRTAREAACMARWSHNCAAPP